MDGQAHVAAENRVSVWVRSVWACERNGPEVSGSPMEVWAELENRLRALRPSSHAGFSLNERVSGQTGPQAPEMGRTVGAGRAEIASLSWPEV
ncbi:MAG: hypothetical protein ACFB9M_21445 [Myxococcota bacterium]